MTMEWFKITIQGNMLITVEKNDLMDIILE